MIVTDFLSNNFGLPDGNLYSNLIASALLGGVGFIYGRSFERREIDRHTEQLAQKDDHQNKVMDEFDKLHSHIDQIVNKVKGEK